jgi:hypothetical protein
MRRRGSMPGSRSLADHATAMYTPYGKRPDPNLLYGLVYTVAAVGALLWLLVIRAVRSRRRSAPVLAVVVTTITAALALLLLVSTDYGAQIFRHCGASCRPLPESSRLCCSFAVGRTADGT